MEPKSSTRRALRQCCARCAGADPVRPAYAFGMGCLAFTDDLHRVTWSRKFRLGITFKYDETTDPREFLQVYTTAMEIAEGGHPHVLANWFPMALKAWPATGYCASLGVPCGHGHTYANSLLMRS
jgi:hypothetical protein